jgi:hypothetical protein
MKKVYCVYEDNHGMVGIAKDYSSAIDGLVKEKWLDGDTEMLDDNNNPSTVKKIFGEENWIDLIKHWDEDTFNIFFDGIFYIDTMEIWGS